jgi:hypothetical protein
MAAVKTIAIERQPSLARDGAANFALPGARSGVNERCAAAGTGGAARRARLDRVSAPGLIIDQKKDPGGSAPGVVGLAPSRGASEHQKKKRRPRRAMRGFMISRTVL